MVEMMAIPGDASELPADSFVWDCSRDGGMAVLWDASGFFGHIKGTAATGVSPRLIGSSKTKHQLRNQDGIEDSPIPLF